MNKRIVLIAVSGVTAAVVIVATTAFLNSQKKKPLRAPVVSETTAAPTPTPVITTETYTDPSGFSFTYPSSIIVTPQKTNDEQTYADIEITATERPGTIHITIIDAPTTTLAQWMKKEKYTLDPRTVKEMSMGGVTASQFIAEGKIITAAIDQQILFTIIVDPQDNDDFWGEVNDGIISSLTFAQAEQTTKPPRSQTSQPDTVAPDELDDGVEEIIE